MHILSTIITFDEWLFFQINSSIHTDFLDWFFLFFSFYPLIIWGSLGLLLVFVEEHTDKTFIIKLFTALILAGAMASVLIKPIIARPRPDISHGIKVVIVDEKPAVIPFNNDYAFPSGHAAIAFAGAYIVTRAQMNRKHKPQRKNYKKIAGWLFYAIAGVTGFSRIYLGKHYPLDVFGGAVVGILMAMVSWYGVEYLWRRVFA